MCEEENILENAVLAVDEVNGIYCVKRFAENYIENNPHLTFIPPVSEEDLNILLDTENEDHSECWQDFISRTTIIQNHTKKEYSIYQDGNIWFVPTE